MGVAPPPPPSYCGEGEIEKVLQIAVIKNLLLLLEISSGVAPSPFWAICGGLISFLFESFVPFRLMDLALAVGVFFVGKGSGCQLIRYLEGWGKFRVLEGSMIICGAWGCISGREVKKSDSG